MIDGSAEAERKLRSMLLWDEQRPGPQETGRVTERTMEAIRREMACVTDMVVTLPHVADEGYNKECF